MITHLNKKNQPLIIDVSSKKMTNREAVAQGKIEFSKSTFKKIQNMKTKKGEIANVAILAGIMAGKKTSDLIPLCHNIELSKIDISIDTDQINNQFIVKSFVKTKSKTGVEMEALTAVSISCLTIYDMCKSLDKKILIKEIKLISKKGGKSDFIQKNP